MIKELLPSGKDNAIPTTELMKLCGMERRQMTKLIHDERAAGAAICSTTAGAGSDSPKKVQNSPKNDDIR